MSSNFMNRRKILQLLVAAPAAYVGATHASIPKGPIRVVAGFAAGGTVDAVARLIAQPLAAELQRTVIVENKPGAAGLIAIQNVAASPPDGNSLVMLSPGATILSARENPPLDVRRQLVPVVQLSSMPLVIYVNSTMPVKSFSELLHG